MYSFEAMNTLISTFGLPKETDKQVEFWFRQVETRLSRFNPVSELSMLNQAAPHPFASTDILFDVIKAAEHYRKETDGLFNPYLGHLLNHLGYNESFEKLKEKVWITESSLEQWNGHEETEPIQLDVENHKISLSSNVSVDLGGIAKGWSAQQMCTQLKNDGITSGVIDAGGDMAIWGEKDQTWEIAVADPYLPDHDLKVLNVRSDIGIATSSTVKRHWRDRNGRALHHITVAR